MNWLKRILMGLGAMFLLMMLVSVVTSFVLKPKAQKLPEKMVLIHDLADGLPGEIASPQGFALKDLLKPQTDFTDMLLGIRRASMDPRVKSIVMIGGGGELGLARVQEWRGALQEFREQGGQVIFYATQTGAGFRGLAEYYLASVADEVWLQPLASINMTAPVAEMPFFKTALDGIGVKAQFITRGQYKNMAESITSDGMSKASRLMLEDLLGDLSTNMIEAAASSRGITPAKFRTILGQTPFNAEDAIPLELIDRLGYWDELRGHLNEAHGADIKPVALNSYLGHRDSANIASPQFADTTPVPVGLVRISGMLMMDDAGFGPMDDVAIAQDVAADIATAADDPNIEALLIRLDSPGGSPEAAEFIRHAIIRFRDDRNLPVIVVMGDVAASGGYWIASAADQIIASPMTLTGSIGVVMGKVVLGGLWDKLDIKWDRVSLADNTNIWSANVPFNRNDLTRLNRIMDHTYQEFLARVATSRGWSVEDAALRAEGRVWSGDAALRNGLVDALGGYNQAFLALRDRLDLVVDHPLELRLFPPQLSPLQQLIEDLENPLKLPQSLRIQAVMPIPKDLQQITNAFAPWLASNQSQDLRLMLHDPYVAYWGEALLL